MGKAVVVLERLTPWTWCMGVLGHFLGHDIVVLDGAQPLAISSKRGRWLSTRSTRVRLPLMGNFLYEAHARALQLCDGLYEDRFATTRIPKLLAHLYQTPEIERAFRKSLNRRLAEFYTLEFTLADIKQKLDRPVYFIPTASDGIYTTPGLNFYEEVRGWLITRGERLTEQRLPVLFYLQERLFRVVERFRAIGESWGLLVWLLLKRLGRDSSNVLTHHAFAINIVAPERQFANDVQTVDFLVDGDQIHSRDVLVVSSKPLNTKQKTTLSHKNVAYVDSVKNLTTSSAIKSVLPTAWELCKAAFIEPPFLVSAGVELAFYAVKWESFLQRASINHFITYSDMDLQSVARSVIFRKHNVASWYYMDSANFPNFFERRDREPVRYTHHRSSYLTTDNFVAWSEDTLKFFGHQKADFRQIHLTGCLWASHVAAISQEEGKRLVQKALDTQHELKKRLIAVFDSTYHDDSPTSMEDGKKFLNAIVHAATMMPDTLWVLKEKKLRAGHPLADLYRQAMVQERIAFLPNHFSASVLISAADLTVSFPFTSTTFEALSAGRRGLYLDASGKFIGTRYDGIPGLVCHSAEEFPAMAERILRLSEAEWSATTAKAFHDIEPFCDGKALTRFREVLSAANKGLRVA